MKTQKTYYYENPVGTRPDHGQFTAADDAEALAKMPVTAIFLYRESDTPDGTPFVVVYEK